MNTNSDKAKELKELIDSFENNRTEEQKLEANALMLMAGYLSEIEKFQQLKGINRKELANKIGTSPSYLTQVFRGDKPLNFATIAKIKEALDLVFVVKAYPRDSFKNLDIHLGQQMFEKKFSRINYSGLTLVAEPSKRA